MKLEARVPPSGKTFHLRVIGSEPLNKGLILLGLLLGISFLALWFVGVPKLPAAVTEATRERITGLFHILQVGLALSCGVVFAIGLFEARERVLEIFGEAGGALMVEGPTIEGGSKRLAAEIGPYSVALIRRIADDVAMARIDVDKAHLFASAQEDASADAAISSFLRTEVAIIDKNGTQTTLLRTKELLPEDVEEVFKKLRQEAGGQLDKLKGGGFVLKLPAPEGGE